MFKSGDQQQIQQFRETHLRLLTLMPRATSGLADTVVIAELEHILTDLNALFHALSPHHPACDPTEVQRTIAETIIHLANAYDALRNSNHAAFLYEQAAQVFETIGQFQQAGECRGAIRRLHFTTEGTFDAEFQHLQEHLTAQIQGSLPYIETVIALGNLYKDADDLFEAERAYASAEQALDLIRPAPLDNNIVLQFEQLLPYCQEIEFLYDLYYRLYSNLVYLYRDRDYAQASKYFQRVHASEAKRSEYRHILTMHIVNMLLANVYEGIILVGQGVLTQTQVDALVGDLNALMVSNRSLPIHLSRDELLQNLQALLMHIEGPGPVQDVAHSFQSYVQQIAALIDGIYQKQAIDQHADLLHLLALQLTFDAVRRELQAFSMQSPAQQHLLAHDLQLKIQELREESQRLDLLEGITTALTLRAELLMALQRNDEAIADLVEAYRLLNDHWQHDRGVAILSRLAEANARKHDWTAVASLCKQGIGLVEQYRYKVTGQYLQSSYLISRIQLYSLGVRSTYELKNYLLMMQWADLSKCRSVLRYQQDTSSLAADQQMQLTEHRFQQVSMQIAMARSDNEMLSELKNKRRTLWDLLTLQRFQSRTEELLPVFSLEAVQATLAEDEAIVYYYWLDKHTLLITVIDQTRNIPVLRILTPEQQTSLQAFANFVLELTDQSALSHLDSVQKFSSLLLPEEITQLLEGKQRLLFSPHRLLHAIPFHALRWNNRYLFEHFAVTYVPNLSSLLYTYTPGKHQRMLALGTHDYAVPGYTLRPLKTAEQEVEDLEQIARMTSIPITALKGPEACIERLQQLVTTGELAQFTRIHFATHGFNIDSDTPMESFLFLRDAKLDGLEIANWQLQADLVVLSACCSGQRPISGRGMEELPGDELFGLQSAFFTAGAKRILSCLWPVDDAVASTVTKSFYLHLTDGLAPEVALQTALKEFLADADIDQDGVYYWGPFFLSALGRSVSTNNEET